MIPNSKYLVGAVVLTASLLFSASFYKTKNAFSALQQFKFVVY
jgi:hypothetical protein